MEFDILYAIQDMHNSVLDSIMVFIFNDITGSKGELWIVLGIVLLLIPKTRKVALCLLSAYIIAYFIGDGILKDLIARPRPCMIDETVDLLISKSTSYSCPSVHSMLAFASTATIFWYYRKVGIAALVFAALVAFSRLYFFVHFPSDVLFGAVLGFLIGTGVYFLQKSAYDKQL